MDDETHVGWMETKIVIFPIWGRPSYPEANQILQKDLTIEKVEMLQSSALINRGVDY